MFSGSPTINVENHWSKQYFHDKFFFFRFSSFFVNLQFIFPFLFWSLSNTDSPRYIRSFYLQFCVYAIQKWPLFWNLSSDLKQSLVFLDANLLYVSIFLESLSLAYNKVHLYVKRWLSAPPFRKKTWTILNLISMLTFKHEFLDFT